MKPSRVSETIDQLFATRWAIFLWGPPGAGKSSIVREAAEMRQIPLVDIRAALLDPTDIRGIPAVVEGTAIWCPPSFLPTADSKPGILFLDELSAAPPLVQASLYQLVLDRRVGEYQLPDGWRIIAAGNRAADRSVSYRMPAALANRFIHVEFEIDFDDWRTWAIDHGIHPLILGFLSIRRELLFDMSQPERGFPTPRSWEIASDALKTGVFGRFTTDLVAGIVGEGAAIEFMAYCDKAISEESIRHILSNPLEAALPVSLADQYALIAYITASARDAATRRAAGQLLKRLPAELAVLMVRDILRSNPGFASDKGYQAFVAEHAELLV